MERAFFLLDRGHPFNGVYVVSLRGPLSQALLEAGLRRVERRHPALRVRIVRESPADDRRLLLTDEGAAPIPLSIVQRRSDWTWQEIVRRELNKPFADGSDHLTRLTWVRGVNDSELVFGQHHVTCDALSITYAVRDLLQELAALIRGHGDTALESPPLQPPLPSLLPKSARGLQRFSHMRSFFYKHVLMRPLRRIRKLPSEKKASPETRRSALIHAELSAETTRLLVEISRKEGASLHAVLCASLLRAAYEVAFADGARSVTLGCSSAVSLRRELEPQVGEEMGLFISQVTTFHRVARRGVTADLWPLAREVKAKLGETLRNGEQYLTMPLIGMFIPWGRQPGASFVKRFDGGSPAALAVTNIGELPIPLVYGPFVVKSCQFAVSPSVVSPLIVTAVRCADVLQLNLIHVEPLCSATRARAILDRALTSLREAAVLSDDADAVG